ncbi:MAG: hypothetical protein A2W31_11505 [Planctomycetes bacterium RBG_16_64_10]|nr:MAG: hypothetical protein A2W31_11505 [Planctomycetes bacterium RBG_16_64_10]
MSDQCPYCGADRQPGLVDYLSKPVYECGTMGERRSYRCLKREAVRLRAELAGRDARIVAMTNQHQAAENALDASRELTGEAMAQCVERERQLKAELAEAQRERDAARAVVERLPKTADGSPITPGMKIYRRVGNGERAWIEANTATGVDAETIRKGTEPWISCFECNCPAADYYSTREAAAAGEGERGGPK